MKWKTLPNQHLFPNYKTLMFTFHSVRSLEVNEWIWDHRHHTSSSYESHNVSGAKFLYFLIFLPKLRQIETKCGVSPIICANLHLIGNVSEFTSVLGAYKLTTSYTKSVILPYFAFIGQFEGICVKMQKVGPAENYGGKVFACWELYELELHADYHQNQCVFL